MFGRTSDRSLRVFVGQGLLLRGRESRSVGRRADYTRCSPRLTSGIRFFRQLGEGLKLESRADIPQMQLAFLIHGQEP